MVRIFFSYNYGLQSDIEHQRPELSSIVELILTFVKYNCLLRYHKLSLCIRSTYMISNLARWRGQWLNCILLNPDQGRLKTERAYIHQAWRHLTPRSHEILKTRDIWLELSARSEIWPAAKAPVKCRSDFYTQVACRTFNLIAYVHDDVIKWKHFPRYWAFLQGIHRSPVNSPHKGQWRGALRFFWSAPWINGWVNNREAGDLRRHHAHYDAIVMATTLDTLSWCHGFICSIMTTYRTYLIYFISRVTRHRF